MELAAKVSLFVDNVEFDNHSLFSVTILSSKYGHFWFKQKKEDHDQKAQLQNKNRKPPGDIMVAIMDFEDFAPVLQTDLSVCQSLLLPTLLIFFCIFSTFSIEEHTLLSMWSLYASNILSLFS